MGGEGGRREGEAEEGEEAKRCPKRRVVEGAECISLLSFCSFSIYAISIFFVHVSALISLFNF